MNERIRELMNQTGVPTSIPFDQWCEKFAELIVRECSQYIEDKFDFCGDEIIIAEAVLKHFGVER